MSLALGLEFSVASFAKGTVDAAKIVKDNFSDKLWKPANAAVQKFAFKLKKDIGDAVKSAASKVKSIGSAIFSVGGAIAAFGVGLVTGKVASFIKDCVLASQALGDAGLVLERAAKASGEALDTAKFKTLAKDLSTAIGVSQTDVIGTAADFIGRGFSADATEELTILAANASKALGGTVGDAGNMIANALNGSVDAAKKLGIQFTETGNAIADKTRLAALLQKQFGDLGSELVDPQESLASNWENITIIIGDKLAPKIGEILTWVNNILTAWQAGSMNSDLNDMMDILAGIGGAIKAVFDVAVQGYRTVVAKVTLLFTFAQTLIDFWTSVFMNGIPALVETIVKLAVDTLLAQFGGTEIGKKLLGKMGIDQAFSDSLGNKIADNVDDIKTRMVPSFKSLGEAGMDAFSNEKKLFGMVVNGDKDPNSASDSIFNRLDGMAQKGEVINQGVQDRLNSRQSLAPQQLLSKKTIEEENIRWDKEQAAKEEKLKAAQAKNSKRFSGNGDATNHDAAIFKFYSRNPHQQRKDPIRFKGR